MIWQFNFYAYALFAVAMMALWVARISWRYEKSKSARPMAALMLTLAWWAAMQGLEVAVADVPGKIFWTQMQYLGIVTAPLLWLVLALQFTQLDTHWLTRRNIALLLIHPIVTALTVWTNSRHHLIWVMVKTVPFGGIQSWSAVYGPGFWIHTVYAYGLMLLGMGILLRAALTYPYPYRSQALILFTGSFVPWVANALTILDLVRAPTDLTPFGFFAAGLMAFWGLFRYHLLDLSPIARTTMVDSVQEGMVALDQRGRIVDINPAARRLLGSVTGELLGRSLAELQPQLQPWAMSQAAPPASSEIALELDGAHHWFDVRVSPLLDYRRRSLGRIIVLHDINDRVQLETSLEEQIYRVKQLLEVARVTTVSPILEDTLRNTLEVAQSITRATAGRIALITGQKEFIHSTLPEDMPVLANFATRVLLEKKVLLADALQGDTLPATTRPPCGAALGAPILYGQGLLGELLLTHPTPQHFTAADVALMEVAIRQMGLALGNALIFEGQRVVAEQQTTLFEILHALQHPMPVQQAIVESVAAISRFTHWPVLAILTPQTETHFQIEAMAGPLAEELLRHCVNTQCISEENAPYNVQLYLPHAQLTIEAIQSDAFPSVLLAPLKSTPPRLLLFASDQEAAFAGDARLLANSLSNIITLVLRNAQLYESVSTEQRRLAALVQASQDGIILIGNDNRVLVMSQTAALYLGLGNDPERWIQRSTMEALHILRDYAPEAVQATLTELKRLREGHTEASAGEYPIQGRIIHWASLAVQDETRSLGRLIILHDVTEERQIARMREDLTHTMVHDLRNPLTSIHSSIWLLNRQLQHTIPANYRSLLEIAQRSTAQLLEMVNAILDISRLESGRMPLAMGSIALAELVANIIELQSPLAQEKNIQLTSAIGSDLPAVWGDPQLIGRVLQNLIGNALKFTPAGGSVQLTGQPLVDMDKVQIAIRDTGPGIPIEIRERIFQKFVTGLQEGHGSGLGLAFCKMVLEAHHERLWVESEPGRGATFTFTLSFESGKSVAALEES
ncbi:MAG TPA: histidine kinase N-terminal 7TM domain-containing protein [Anaerolineae bacterium]|nr:histidine kinase N-terminal 7TM domain-containing protein [Anaerolineae bacterium]